MIQLYLEFVAEIDVQYYPHVIWLIQKRKNDEENKDERRWDQPKQKVNAQVVCMASAHKVDLC